MHASDGERLVCVGPPTPTPRLSVVTPFHRHDPSPLLAAMAGAPRDVEFVLLDDGSGSASLLANVIAAAERVKAPVRIVVWPTNRGRAEARNRLIAEARGEYVLFLDADMIPDGADFLRNWLEVIQTQRPFVAFGGLSLAQAERTPETALHHNLFERSDCAPAHVRARRGAQAVASANLLVRRDFLRAAPFDASFTGWGFEDVDWALSAAQRAPILHIDNPATHAGLDDIDVLMRKSDEAGANFARLAAKHPQKVSRFAAHRVASVLKLAPMRAHLRQLFAWFARDPLSATPMPVRRAAFKLYRASCFAEHLA
jgi:glycosyltransferase involved in cell wall biosynthesis